MLFLYPLICPSVFQSLPVYSSSPPLTLADGLCPLNTAPFIADTLFPSLAAFHGLPSVGDSHTLCQNDFDFSPDCMDFAHRFWVNQTQNMIVFSLLEMFQFYFFFAKTCLIDRLVVLFLISIKTVPLLIH